MSEERKDFVAGLSSDARKTPVRVAFVTRRTSPAVKVEDEDRLMTHPGVFFRVAVAVEVLAVFLVWLSLLWNAPLEGLADPMHTPNPAKAPWYFLGLQELLHYFPPVVAGVLIPTLVIIALIVIPYFNINVEAEGLFLRDRTLRVRIVVAVLAALVIFFVGFNVYVALVPTLVVGALMFLGARDAGRGVSTGLAAKPLSFWIMTWFLGELVLLTVIGTFFRGPGWSWVLPWRGY
jgi:menaquinol-cytochrome c reductase cytochrome b/c subunit